MMASEIMGSISLENFRPLSPELQLGTMSTADMFDTNWESSSEDRGGDSSQDSSSPSTSNTLDDLHDDLFSWDAEQALQANLFGTNLEEDLENDGVLLPLSCDFPLDLDLLHDTSSNMSSLSDSSTITAFSITQDSTQLDSLLTHFDSQHHFNDLENSKDNTAFEDIQDLQNPSIIDTTANGTHTIDKLDEPKGVSALKNNTMVNALSSNIPDTTDESDNIASTALSKVKHPNNFDEPQNDRIYGLKPKDNTKIVTQKLEKHIRDTNSPQKSHRSPLKTAHYVTHNAAKVPDLPRGSSKQQAQPLTSKYKASAKENHTAMRKKKLHDILDSHRQWSELSGSDQWMVGEGLSVLVSQSLGVRERMDVLKILGGSSSSSPHDLLSGELNLTPLLDDHSLKAIRRYLRLLETENTSLSNKKLKGKYGKHTPRKHNNKASSKKKELSNNSLKYKGTFSAKSVQSFSLPSITEADANNPWTKGELCGRRNKKSFPRTTQQNKRVKMNGSGLTSEQYHKNRKSYMQGLKEKRSGLFKQETVVHMSSTANTATTHKINHSDSDDEDEIDILG